MAREKKKKKKKKKKTRREKCEAGACKMCYALQLSGLECDHHVPRVQWHEPLPVIFSTSGAIPKCVVKKKQVAAVFDEAKQSDNVKRAMDELAKSGKFLEIEVDAHCPDGELSKSRLDSTQQAMQMSWTSRRRRSLKYIRYNGAAQAVAMSRQRTSSWCYLRELCQYHCRFRPEQSPCPDVWR